MGQPAVDYVGWKQWDAASFGRCSASQTRYFDWQLARCGGPPVRSALEIGFGNGAFLGYALARGIAVQGVEIEPELCSRARALGVPAASDLAALDKATAFDLIVAFDVFEHLTPDALRGLLVDLKPRLALRGRILCRVPNGDSPFGRKHQHGDATHVGTYGLSQLVQIGGEAGLAVRSLGDAPWYAMPDRKRNLSNLARAGVQALLEGAVRYAYRWPGLWLGPNLVAVFEAA